MLHHLTLILLLCMVPFASTADEYKPRYRNAAEAAAAASAFNASNVSAWGTSPAPTYAHPGQRIILYRAGCGYECQQLTLYLQAHNLPYSVRDIGHNTHYRDEYTRMGGTGMPIVVLGGTLMPSLDGALIAQRYAEMQQASGWPPAPAKSGKRPIEEGDLLKPKINGVALYSEPDSSSKQMRSLTSKESCVYLGEEENNFYQVTCKAETGWIDRRMLKR